MRDHLLATGILVLFAYGCGSDSGAPLPPVPYPDFQTLPASPQRAGDPVAGYQALVNNGYVSCGIPYSLFSQLYPPADASVLLPGRNADNAQIPYNFTAFTAKSGVELVTANCLSCHASSINGQLVVGLGDANQDLTIDAGGPAQALGGLIPDPTEHSEWQKWADRVSTIAPYIRPLTVGVNSADNLAAALFAHRDPTTLAWSDQALLDPPPTMVVPVDVPPWWRMKKKNTMFYSAAGRGDHSRIMMTASTLCTDDVPDAMAIDSYFNDINAYLTSLTPPPYPFPINQDLVPHGRAVFIATCAHCHGTYDADDSSYPNLWVPQDFVGTDPTLSMGAAQLAGRFVDWFNSSFYGQTAKLEPQPGYVPPPLDGIWATAPYLHNGSVPTLRALLSSSTRPTYFTRTYDSTDYNPDDVGWNFTPVPTGQAAEPDELKRKLIYDTTLPGYSNAGHTFGDILSADDRDALLEYLKTL